VVVGAGEEKAYEKSWESRKDGWKRRQVKRTKRIICKRRLMAERSLKIEDGLKDSMNWLHTSKMTLVNATYLTSTKQTLPWAMGSIHNKLLSRKKTLSDECFQQLNDLGFC
jgi:hypothetical protein